MRFTKLLNGSESRLIFKFGFIHWQKGDNLHQKVHHLCKQIRRLMPVYVRDEKWNQTIACQNPKRILHISSAFSLLREGGMY